MGSTSGTLAALISEVSLSAYIFVSCSAQLFPQQSYSDLDTVISEDESSVGIGELGGGHFEGVFERLKRWNRKVRFVEGMYVETELRESTVRKKSWQLS
jgi:hypothetical protein